MPAQAALARICQVTGLKLDLAAERLIKVNAVTSVLFLAFGGITGLLVALTRWQAVHLLPSKAFYEILTAHGATMLIYWIVFFEIAGLIFAGTALINSRLLAPKAGWLAYAMMLGGALVSEVTMLSGHATVMFTAYPPLKATPWFYASVLVFAVGTLIAVVHFLINVGAARRRGDVGRSLPLFTFAMVAAAILALFTLLSGAGALVPAFLWSLGLIPAVDPGIYRLLYWGFGHGAQQVNLAAMIGIWYGLASLTTGAKPLNEKLSRFAFLLYVMFIQMGSIHHLIVDPGLSKWAVGLNTSYFMYAAVLGSMIHAFTIPSSVEVAMREKGGVPSRFGWLRRLPWGSPGFAAMAMSILVFGLIGGTSGVIMGTMQINQLAHNTFIVPAHFHMTVAAGTTLAFMGISYYLLPLIFRRDLAFPRLAQIQPYLFAAGMVIWGLGAGLVGHLGVPRRTWDITYVHSPIPIHVFETFWVNFSLALLGIGAVIACAAGAAYVLIAAWTALFSRRAERPNIIQVDAGAFGVPLVAGGADTANDEGQPPTPRLGGDWPSGAAGAQPAVHHGLEAPGTLVIAFAWFTLFVVLYCISWFELGTKSWGVG